MEDYKAHDCETCNVAGKCPLKPIVDFEKEHDGLITKLLRSRMTDLYDLIEPTFEPFYREVGNTATAYSVAPALSRMLADVSQLVFAAGFTTGYDYPKAGGQTHPDAILKAAVAAGWKSPQEVDKMLQEAFESGKENG